MKDTWWKSVLEPAIKIQEWSGNVTSVEISDESRGPRRVPNSIINRSLAKCSQEGKYNPPPGTERNSKYYLNLKKSDYADITGVYLADYAKDSKERLLFYSLSKESADEFAYRFNFDNSGYYDFDISVKKIDMHSIMLRKGTSGYNFYATSHNRYLYHGLDIVKAITIRDEYESSNDCYIKKETKRINSIKRYHVDGKIHGLGFREGKWVVRGRDHGRNIYLYRGTDKEEAIRIRQGWENAQIDEYEKLISA